MLPLRTARDDFPKAALHQPWWALPNDATCTGVSGAQKASFAKSRNLVAGPKLSVAHALEKATLRRERSRQMSSNGKGAGLCDHSFVWDQGPLAALSGPLNFVLRAHAAQKRPHLRGNLILRRGGDCSRSCRLQ